MRFDAFSWRSAVLVNVLTLGLSLGGCESDDTTANTPSTEPDSGQTVTADASESGGSVTADATATPDTGAPSTDAGSAEDTSSPGDSAAGQDTAGPAAPDASAECSDEQLSTVDGCLGCTEALTAVDAAKVAAHEQYGACTSDDQCELVSADTACAGDCSWAASDPASFTAALQAISGDYCDGYADLCGFMSPGCLPGTAVCGANGLCEVSYSACMDPSPEGCATTGCPAGQVCDTTLGCNPSSCTCDESMGIWDCTKDCGGGVCVVEDGQCTDEQVPTVDGCLDCEEAMTAVNAAKVVAQLQNGYCTSDDQCQLANASTACQGDCPAVVSDVSGYENALQAISAQYCGGYAEVCGYATPSCLPATPRCGETGICEAVYDICEGASPEGCSSTGCPSGQVCDTSQGCAPSSCFCDGGFWTCTEDCGGGVCVDDPGNTGECTDEQVPTVEGCLSCSDALGAVHEAKSAAQLQYGQCTSNEQCKMVSADTGCEGDCAWAVSDPGGFAGALASITADYCGGFTPVCGYATPDCMPGSPVCGEDGVCKVTTDDGECDEATNPAGCVMTGCPSGQVCDTTQGCAPSSCFCANPATNVWGCTMDCGGGVCVDDPGNTGECTSDQVSTIDGCLSCGEALSVVQEGKVAAKAMYDACSVDDDCAVSWGGTGCAGDCQWAVSDVAAWEAALSQLSEDYCTGYMDSCPFMTPMCLPGTAVCTNGHCEMEWGDF